jgi:hypothetical protein
MNEWISSYLKTTIQMKRQEKFRNFQATALPQLFHINVKYLYRGHLRGIIILPHHLLLQIHGFIAIQYNNKLFCV